MSWRCLSHLAAYKVLLATVLINCLVKGTLKSLGVLMLELDSLGVDTTSAAWIPAIAYTLFAVLSTPVAKCVVNIFERSLSFCSGLKNGFPTALCLSSAVPSLFLASSFPPGLSSSTST